MSEEKLIKETMKYLDRAYTPYSHFNVAACVKTKKGNYFGVNIENASYGLAVCAERNAIFQAYINGVAKEDIECLIVATQQDDLIFPCGACRQVMVELLPQQTEVIIANENAQKSTTVAELMPNAFSQEDLQ